MAAEPEAIKATIYNKNTWLNPRILRQHDGTIKNLKSSTSEEGFIFACVLICYHGHFSRKCCYSLKEIRKYTSAA